LKQLAPPSSDSKVLAVQSWDGVPRKNPHEPPYNCIELNKSLISPNHIAEKFLSYSKTTVITFSFEKSKLKMNLKLLIIPCFVKS